MAQISESWEMMMVLQLPDYVTLEIPTLVVVGELYSFVVVDEYPLVAVDAIQEPCHDTLELLELENKLG